MGCMTDKGHMQVSAWGTYNSLSGWGALDRGKQIPSFLAPSLLLLFLPPGLHKRWGRRHTNYSQLDQTICASSDRCPQQSSEGISLWCSPRSRRCHSVTNLIGEATLNVLLEEEKGVRSREHLANSNRGEYISYGAGEGLHYLLRWWNQMRTNLRKKKMINSSRNRCQCWTWAAVWSFKSEKVCNSFNTTMGVKYHHHLRWHWDGKVCKCHDQTLIIRHGEKYLPLLAEPVDVSV